MCTCIDFRSKYFYFGRNLDLEYNFGEKVVITPRDYLFELKNGSKLKTKYAIMGMATVVNNYPLYADAVNEKGLCMAGLYFPGNAVYNKEIEQNINIASFELIPWVLGNFSNITELKKELNNLNIIDAKFNENLSAVQLHWMISDEDESIVLEQVEDGLKIYDNPFGVLTNNPPFHYHKINISNYMNLSCKYPENRFTDKIDLEVFGQGISMIGLPGDVTPPARFVRAAFNKSNSVECSNENEAISQFFHILDSVAMLKGTVLTKENKLDMTTYSSCINASKGIYYFKTYYNNQINAVKFNENNINSKELEIHELHITQNVKYLN